MVWLDALNCDESLKLVNIAWEASFAYHPDVMKDQQLFSLHDTSSYAAFCLASPFTPIKMIRVSKDF